jgi:hypothetical protein
LTLQCRYMSQHVVGMPLGVSPTPWPCSL